MLRSKSILLLAVAVVLTSFAFAHEGHEKCTLSTQDCLDHMASTMRNGVWLGVELEPDQATGAWTVHKVIPGSPAETAGIQPGDVLYAANGIRMSSDNEEAFMKAKKEWRSGQQVNYTIRRDNVDRQVVVTLATMPADMVAAYIGKHMLDHAAVQVAEKK